MNSKMNYRELVTDDFIKALRLQIHFLRPFTQKQIGFAFPDEETEELVRVAKMFSNRCVWFLYALGEIDTEEYLREIFVIY